MSFKKVHNKDGTMFLVHSDLNYECFAKRYHNPNGSITAKRKKPLIMHSNLTRNRKDRAMSNSIYYKAMDEDGNIILRHSYNKPGKKKQFEANSRRAQRNSAFVKQRQDQKKSQFEANAKRQEDPFVNAKSNAAFVKQKQEQQKKQFEANGRAKSNVAFVKQKQEQQKKQFETNAKRQKDLRAFTKRAKEASRSLNKIKKAGKYYLKHLTK